MRSRKGSIVEVGGGGGGKELKTVEISLYSRSYPGYFFAVYSLRLNSSWPVMALGKMKQGAFSIYKKIRKFSIGNFRLGKARSICYKSHSREAWPLKRPRKSWNWW